MNRGLKRKENFEFDYSNLKKTKPSKSNDSSDDSDENNSSWIKNDMKDTLFNDNKDVGRTVHHKSKRKRGSGYDDDFSTIEDQLQQMSLQKQQLEDTNQKHSRGLLSWRDTYKKISDQNKLLLGQIEQLQKEKDEILREKELFRTTLSKGLKTWQDDSETNKILMEQNDQLQREKSALQTTLMLYVQRLRQLEIDGRSCRCNNNRWIY